MSVFHEVKIEHALDAADKLIEKPDTNPKIKEIREKISKALEIATDLPDDSVESVRLLNTSNRFLTKALNRVNSDDGLGWRLLCNAIITAWNANAELIKELKVK
jgi:hypothetical protein